MPIFPLAKFYLNRLSKELEQAKNLLAKEMLLSSVLAEENSKLRALARSLRRKQALLRRSQSIIESNYQTLRAENTGLREKFQASTARPEDYILSRKLNCKVKSFSQFNN